MGRRQFVNLDPVSKRRFLHCEILEPRSMLTGFVESLEIAPGPVSEFTTQAKSFIESAIENVAATQQQAPIRTSTELYSDTTSEGLTVRITKFTVELADINLTQTSRTDTPVLSNASLVFTFYVYPDSSVSIRAKITTPLVNIVLPKFSLESANPKDIDAGEELRPTEVPSSERVPSKANRVEGMQSETASLLGSQSGNAPTKSAELTTDSRESQLLAGNNSAVEKSPDWIIKPTDNSEPVVANEAVESESLHPPVQGMVCLEFVQPESSRTQSGFEPEASAMFQVFINSAIQRRVSDVAARPYHDATETTDVFVESSAEPLGEFDPLALSMLTLVGSCWLSIRNRHADKNEIASRDTNTPQQPQ